jgi:hypothetical protein
MLIRSMEYLNKSFRLNTTRAFRRFTDGIELQENGVFVRKNRNVLVVLRTPSGSLLIPASNIVTSAGDNYYAAKSVGAATTAFTTLSLGTGKTGAWAKSSVYSNLTGAIAGSIQAVDATYPLVSDPDTDNAASAATATVSWRWSYTKASFTSVTSVTDGAVTVTSPVAGSALLSGFTLTNAFTKTVDDTIKVFLNHAILGS